MRSNIFYIEKYRMTFSIEDLPAFDEWVAKYNVLKKLGKNTYGIDLLYNKDMFFYEQCVSRLNDTDKILLYRAILEKLYNKTNGLAIIGQSLKRKGSDTNITRKEELEIIERSASFSDNWFEKEITNFLSKVGYKIKKSHMAMEDLLSYELALRPYMLQECNNILLNQQEELMKYESCKEVLKGLQDLIPLLSNKEGLDRHNSIYCISHKFSVVIIMKNINIHSKKKVLFKLGNNT
jgi:hypothetical protein